MLLLKILGVLLLLYVAAIFALLRLETRMVFPAPQIDRSALQAQAQALGAQERTVVTEDGVPLYGRRRGKSDKLALIFSGNGASVGQFGEREALFLELGFETLHVNYRGYPGSPGTPSEAGLVQDGRAIYAEALRTHSPENILVFGKSLGGGVAIAALSGHERPPAGLIVESSFKSIAAVAFRRFPILPTGLLMRNPFDSLARAPAVASPALVLHSQSDDLIPFTHGQVLAQSLPDARLVAFDGLDHNADLLAEEAGRAALLDFMEEISLRKAP